MWKSISQYFDSIYGLFLAVFVREILLPAIWPLGFFKSNSLGFFCIQKAFAVLGTFKKNAIRT